MPRETRRKPPRVVHVDEIEAIPGPGTLTWHPVRATLGIRAFGTNAYTADQAGQDVVEPHTESPESTHEELYFVARGRATFSLDGERWDAPAGTYVFVPDPGTPRHAVAAEAPVTVLSFGGPPTFEPSAWEWTFRAAAVRDTDPKAARDILGEALRLYPEKASVHYELACLSASEGDREEAMAQLRAALDLDPDLAEFARDDEDFASLRGYPRFEELVG